MTTPVTNALIRETQTISIVIVTVADPISSGFVANLGRPGGNLTGFALYEPSMGGKWLELLKQIAPGDASGAAVQSGNDCAGQILHVLH